MNQPDLAGAGRRLLGSVRVRVTLAALVVVGATLAVGGIGLVVLLHRSLWNNLVTTATTQADDIATVAAGGSLPADLKTRPDTAILVIDNSGQVLVASNDLAGRAAPVPTPKVGARVVTTIPGILPGDDDTDVVVATTVDSPDGPRSIFVLASDEQVEASTRSLAVALSAGLPVLLAIVGVLIWVLTGRAFRPVEAIRQEVDGISVGDLHRRVPVPPVNDEVGRLARTMNAMLSRLEAARDRQRQFVSDASHELRSPLAAILAQLEVARSRPVEADWPAVAAALTEESSRLSRIVDDLLLLARADEGRLVAGSDPVDLDDIVVDEARRLRAQGRVAVDLHALGAGRVHGDREQFRRVVRNLADNAERHAASTVAFELHSHDGWVELVVADDGPGIPPDQRSRIFERFSRVDEARDRPMGGTGLGLAIVGETVALYGGTVGVADSPRGARFVVRLPSDGS